MCTSVSSDEMTMALNGSFVMSSMKEEAGVGFLLI